MFFLQKAHSRLSGQNKETGKFVSFHVLKIGGIVRLFGFVYILSFLAVPNVRADFVFSGSLRRGCVSSGTKSTPLKSHYSTAKSPNTVFINLAKVLQDTHQINADKPNTNQQKAGQQKLSPQNSQEKSGNTKSVSPVFSVPLLYESLDRGVIQNKTGKRRGAALPF